MGGEGGRGRENFASVLFYLMLCTKVARLVSLCVCVCLCACLYVCVHVYVCKDVCAIKY